MNPSDFIIGGLAATSAIFFTNPLEVIKTRLQLQGELASRGTYVEPYRSIPHAFVTIVRNDGWRSLQKGLVPAMYFQFILNSVRLGIYKTAVTKHWIHDRNGEVSFGLGLFWGALGGVTGAYCASPFFMIKTQLQSRASKQIAVGYQHEYTGMLDAFRHILQHRGGVYGLWRGSTAIIPRVAVGSSAQIATFGKVKELLRQHDLVTHPLLVSLCAAFTAGSVVALAITPPDVISTRLYNQGVNARGKGLYYSGWLDCFVKVLRTEGLHGLYKGFWANYLRQAPHSTLVLLFFDVYLGIRDKYSSKLTDAR